MRSLVPLTPSVILNLGALIMKFCNMKRGGGEERCEVRRRGRETLANGSKRLESISWTDVWVLAQMLFYNNE